MGTQKTCLARLVRMSQDKKNFLSHGIMFHHFHDGKKHLKSPGSLSKNEFNKLINYIGKKNIINPDDFIKKLENKSLKKKEVCLTFDDALRCQYDIAYPILKKLKLKAFFFIQTSIYEKNSDMSEVYRYFRNNFYTDVKNFYSDFFYQINKTKKEKLSLFLKSKKKLIRIKKKMYPFYDEDDIKFRLVRDNFLKKNDYSKIMIKMFSSKKFNYKNHFKNIFIKKSQIKKLSRENNYIGLHSHSHTFNFDNLNYHDQKKEYFKNYKILNNIVKKKILSASYPGGKYNSYSIKILKKLGIKCCFKDNFKFKKNKVSNYFLEMPREDSSNIIKKINQK